MKLGFIGTGAITEAIVMGLLRAGRNFDEIVVSARGKDTALRLAAQSSRISIDPDNQSIVDRSDIVFFAVRPQVARSVLSGLVIADDKEIVSLIASLPIETIREWNATTARVVRAIPLPAVADLRGVTAIYPQSDTVEKLFLPLGTVVAAATVAEFDTYAVASSLMGTYFGLLGTISHWMETSGANPAAARTYLSSLFLGLAHTAKEDGSSFEDLRLGHSTPNGLNALAHDVFAKQGGYSALEMAMAGIRQRLEERAFLTLEN
jgi:pyrroline-5-carboxylate reductase